ncbi:MAG: hypothetical protein HY762_04550 [Planctomycetes bacterium]|nr:hypothetical protein [Planctomycetota bacterium]
MKIVILTPADHFHSPVILRAIGQMSDNEIVVVTTPKLGSNSLSRLSKIIKQSGSDYLVSFIMAKICYLVLGAAERLLGKPFQARQFLSVDEVISHFNFRRLNLWNVNGLQDVQLLKELNPDIIITLFFNQMLKEPVLKLARYGNINIHPSFLPAYRGISPCFWALANGESQTGISIHYLTPGIDEGNLLWQ